MQTNQHGERSDGSPSPEQKHVSQGRGLWLISCALVFVAIWGGVLSNGALPEALGRNAHEMRFSSARAMDVLVNLLGQEGAHPVGSPGGARIRERLVRTLTEAGAEVEIQRAWVQSPGRPNHIALVHNVIGHFPGSGEGKDALLMAHYDSVGAGPGAADDLAGVAAWVEAVRAFRARVQGPQKTGLWVLITEGEEDGLFGAQAFAQEHSAMDRIGLVVNLEARGATGVSRLFETSLGNGPWIHMYGKHVERPSANSLSVEIYRRMPNGSDLQIFIDRGLAALNFAFIGDWAVYHSPMDTPQRLDPQTLQHQGDNALAVLNGLEADDSLLRGNTVKRGEDGVHVDILGGYLLQYSTAIQWAAVTLILLLWMFWWVRLAKKGLTPKNALAGFGVAVLEVSLPLAWLAAALWFAARMAGTDMVFWSRPMPAVALAVGSYFMANGVVLRLARNCPPVALRFASATCAVAWSVVLAWFLPGGGFLWVPATLFLMVCLCVLQGRWVDRMPKGWGMGWGAFAGAMVISMLVWIPLHHGLLDAFGFSNALGLLLPVALPSTLLLPFMWKSRRSVGWAAFLVGGLCLGFGLAVSISDEPYTPEKPGTFNVSYTRIQGQNMARVDTYTLGFGWPEGVPAIDDKLLEIPEPLHSVGSARLSAPEPKNLEAPTWSVQSVTAEGKQVYHLHSPRGAQGFRLDLNGNSCREIGIEGRTFDLPPAQSLSFLGVPANGVEVEVLWEPGQDGRPLTLTDRTLGLPPAIAEWAALAGPTWVPRHWGHQTQVVSSIPIFMVDIEPRPETPSGSGD
ncbi:MAG: M20/M25/M40 family metallo-hydrolase [Planctomycetota bacterium]|nr:M20/M25/M40 family metallo-hydrolase [Planctomycetota bacterium]